jgi:sugar-specific transcriptional regulator TrmB
MGIAEVIESLGVNAEEAKVYLRLLVSGPSPAGSLYKRLGVPRATLYDMLAKLTHLGVVLVSVEAKVKTFRAQRPEQLNLLFEKRIQQLQLQQHNLNKITPFLNKKYANEHLPPRYEFFDGIDSVKNAMQDFLFHHNIESFNLWNAKLVELLGMEHFFYANRKRLENNITQKLLISNSKDFSVKKYPFTGEGAFFKRELRLAPESMKNPMSYWVYANKVLFLSSRAEAYAYIIESSEMSQLMQEHFMSVWQVSNLYRMKPGEADPFIAYMEKVKNEYRGN